MYSADFDTLEEVIVLDEAAHEEAQQDDEGGD